MRILGINCQGLGTDPTVQALSDVRMQCDSEVIFLSETHLDDFPANCLRRRLNMDYKTVNLVMVEAVVLSYSGNER
jgi:hypothetical protein